MKPETLKGYSIAFRAIVADIFQINGGKEKYDYKGGGHAGWLAKINAIRLSEVTPARVQEWKRTFIAKAGDDPLKQRSARTSFNSFIRRAKSLFGPKCIKHLSLTLPSPLPFDGIAFEPRQSARYRSNIKPAELTQAAQKELSEADPPVFLAFLLALGAGLRRIAIDRLEWSAFRFEDNVIRIERTRHFEPKTEHSIGDVQVDPELMAVFRGYAALSRSNFVIENGATGEPADQYWDHYRAKEVFERLSVWLRKQGVTARKPIHELRKEFGSMVNRKHGLTAAKDLLRHADIGVTAAYYIDSPRKATSGIGALLVTKRKGKKIIEFKDDVGNSPIKRTSHMTDMNQIEYLQQPMPEFPTLIFRFAKTMASNPHAYTRRTPETETEFAQLANRIAAEGVLEQWKDGRSYRYLTIGPFRYWHLEPCINRARTSLAP